MKKEIITFSVKRRNIILIWLGACDGKASIIFLSPLHSQINLP
ncbi:hypothetical protein [uncultured Clostridium sp.]|nr:hypothetical protein [uncultured Clostridium sp.]